MYVYQYKILLQHGARHISFSEDIKDYDTYVFFFLCIRAQCLQVISNKAVLLVDLSRTQVSHLHNLYILTLNSDTVSSRPSVQHLQGSQHFSILCLSFMQSTSMSRKFIVAQGMGHNGQMPCYTVLIKATQLYVINSNAWTALHF